MSETRKVTMEQQVGDNLRRIILEQGVQDESQTPQWDTLKTTIKEQSAEKLTIFGTAFIRSLGPTFIFICLIIAVMFFVCGR